MADESDSIANRIDDDLANNMVCPILHERTFAFALLASADMVGTANPPPATGEQVRQGHRFAWVGTKRLACIDATNPDARPSHQAPQARKEKGRMMPLIRIAEARAGPMTGDAFQRRACRAYRLPDTGA